MEHIEGKVSKDVYLSDIDLAIDNLALRIQPKDNEGGNNPKWNEI